MAEAGERTRRTAAVASEQTVGRDFEGGDEDAQLGEAVGLLGGQQRVGDEVAEAGAVGAS